MIHDASFLTFFSGRDFHTVTHNIVTVILKWQCGSEKPILCSIIFLDVHIKSWGEMQNGPWHHLQARKDYYFYFLEAKHSQIQSFFQNKQKKSTFLANTHFTLCVWIFGAWHTQQTSQKVRKKVFNWSEVHLYHSNFLQNPYLTTIPVEPGFLWHFVRLSLKTCSLYHEKLFIQKF